MKTKDVVKKIPTVGLRVMLNDAGMKLSAPNMIPRFLPKKQVLAGYLGEDPQWKPDTGCERSLKVRGTKGESLKVFIHGYTDKSGVKHDKYRITKVWFTDAQVKRIWAWLEIEADN